MFVGQHGHPVLRIRGQILRVAFKLRQVVERIGPAQLARMDQAHKDVAYVRAVAGFVKQSVLAMQDRQAVGHDRFQIRRQIPR
jgi:hypothetical protein